MKKILYVIILVIIIITVLLIFNSDILIVSSSDNVTNEFNKIFYEENNNNEGNDIVYENNNDNEIINNEEPIAEKLSATKETIKNYEKSQNTIVAKVNNYEIDEKYLCITKHFYSDSSDLLKQEIENIVLFGLAKENNIIIDTKDKQYINDVINGMREDIANSDIFKETGISEDEYLQLIKEYMEKISIIFEYRSFINDRIKDGTLEIDDVELRKEYDDYLKVYTEWKKEKDLEEYKQISDYQEEILTKYIEYQVSQAEVIIY